MEKAKIAALNEAGINKFAEWINAADKTSKTPPPRDLIFDPSMTEELVGVQEIERRPFDSKYDLGMHVAGAMGPHAAKLLGQVGVWPWLSLFYADVLFPKKDEEFFVGNLSRHIIGKDTSWSSYNHNHRHLVRSAVFFTCKYGHKARCFLDCRPDQHTKLEEQIASRKAEIGLDACDSIITAIYRLYYDSKKGRVRKGAKGTGDGSIVRLIDVLRQFDLTFDLHSLPPDEFIEMLPSPEFSKWKDALTD